MLQEKLSGNGAKLLESAYLFANRYNDVMGSRKPSAKAKRVQQFKSQLGGMDDAFASEQRRKKRKSAEKEAAKRKKACESKNRYPTQAEALAAIADCEAFGTRGLKTYRCPYCNGWHLTSHPWD